MAVTLTISGIDPRGGVEKHTAPDGATIAVRRTHDGFLSIVINPPEPAPVAQAETTRTVREFDKSGCLTNGHDVLKPKVSHDRNDVLVRLREGPDLATAVAREINILRERQEHGQKQFFSELMAVRNELIQIARQEAARASDEGIKALLKTGVRISMDLAADVAAEGSHG